MQGRVQLCCGHVEIDRMIIHGDNSNQGFFYFILFFFFFLGGGGRGGGHWGRVEVQSK